MGKPGLVATIKTDPGKHDEYRQHLKAHSQRYLATEPRLRWPKSLHFVGLI